MEVVAKYRRHGWELRSALLQPATRTELEAQEPELLKNVSIREATFDALWFSRPSHNNRDAWELRLLSQNPYALFETFEPDETEEQREEFRQEMEARMRYVLPLTLGLIVVLLYFSLKGWSQTLLVLTSLPFAVAGSVWLLAALSYNLSTAVWVGLIAVGGVAAQTGIVIVV